MQVPIQVSNEIVFQNECHIYGIFIRLDIPVFGIVDTNSDPNSVDHVIPANDDAKQSIEVILDACCAAIAEGLEERKAEKVDQEAKEVEEKAPRKRTTRARKEKSEEGVEAESATTPATEETPKAE